ncbi:MAG: tRNA preQ1(34) S-adenosylmethionine ribosyltransferase-isomerase QueA [Bacillota bacterium]|nr:tRNA preQ1(34) S-adenosylmethionine ribosyltransferase-isomerase QueA [Bacillota bacterium]
MRVSDFDYSLPEHLIAQDPLEPRDASRLLILDKRNGAIEHSVFKRIGEQLRRGDMLVLNDTKVLPARIFAHKDSGAMIELLLLKQTGLNIWQCLVRPGNKAKPGARLLFGLPELQAEIVDHAEEGTRLVEFSYQGNFFDLLDRLGTMPLPPYIKKPLADQSRYQPVYAREKGSAAAPTAGLHFTERLLDELEAQGVLIEKLLLHVGLGTFRPVKADTVEQHLMHAEYYRLSVASAARINAAKAAGGRLIAVGTTVVRTLETVADEDGSLSAAEGWTQKYIYPGYRFKCTDAMITNFHLPKSTLLMLVAALAGRDNVLRAYQTAIDEQYRFFSFGDAMFITDRMPDTER